MKAGCVLRSLTLPIASRGVPSASGLAGLLKPIWLSLICAKVKAEASAASASPIRPKDFGTPPDSVHKTPVPAQIMHARAPRRSTSGPPIFRLVPSLIIVFLHVAFWFSLRATPSSLAVFARPDSRLGGYLAAA